MTDRMPPDRMPPDRMPEPPPVGPVLARPHLAGPAAPATRRAPTRRKTRAPGPRPRSANDTSETLTRELVVIGRGRRARSIAERLERLRLRVRRLRDVDQALPTLTDATRAVVLVEPLPEVELTDTVTELATDQARTVFVVVPEDYPNRRARRFYEAGATAVFSWPREALVLPAMMSDLLRVSPRRGHKRGDAALARAVRARLELAEDRDVRARIVGGVVSLHGQVTSYWKQSRLVDMLGQIPGVLSVHCENLEIVPVARPDDELRQDVRNILLSVAGVDAQTITVVVEGGVVHLTGTVSRHGELRRLVNVVGNVEGVRGIQSHVVVSASGNEARGLASRLRKRIDALCPSADVDVTVFGTIAIIDGRATTLAEKRAIEDLARDTPGIGRVVNKLTVAP